MLFSNFDHDLGDGHIIEAASVRNELTVAGSASRAQPGGSDGLSGALFSRDKVPTRFYPEKTVRAASPDS